MQKIATTLLSLVFLGAAVASQESLIRLKKIEITADDDSKVIIHRWGDKIPVMIYLFEGKRLNASCPSLTEVENAQIDSLQIAGGVFSGDELDGVGYRSVSFLFGDMVRKGRTPESSYCRMSFLFYKERLQEVWVYVPLEENSKQLLVRAAEKGSNYRSGDETHPTLEAYLTKTRAGD